MITPLTEKTDYSCRVFRYEDEEGVKRLIKNAFANFLDGEFWDWKYKLNPCFDPSLLMIAEKNGEVIGCNHWLLKNFKLSPSLETKAVLGADIAVNPECRGQGVGKALLRSLRSSEVMRTETPSIIYMFAASSLAETFHTPAGGYIPAPDKTAFYFKILNWKKVEKRMHLLNEQIKAGAFKNKLLNLELKVLFKVSHAPPLYFCMSEKGVTISKEGQNWDRNADIVIVSDVATLQKVGAKKKRLWKLFKAVFTRKLKIKGRLKKLVTFYKNVWILEEIFSSEIL